MQVTEACEQCRVFEGVKATSMQKFINYGVLRNYTKKELIFREWEPGTRFYFVASGYVALYKTNQRHDRKVIFILGPGEMLNEVIAEEPMASISCMALGTVSILSCGREQLLSIMERDLILYRNVMRSMAQKLRRTYHQLGNASNMMSLKMQAASKLWKLARDFGVAEQGEIRIPFEISITFFADMMGSKRETVSRILKEICEQDALKISRNYFYILDVEKLKNIVEN